MALDGRRVLVTGAGGFIGSHVVRALLARGADVHAMSPSVSSVVPPRLADIAGDIHLVEANVTDRSAMDAVARSVRPELVAHLAAFTHVGKSFARVDENVATNIQGTVNLLQALAGDYERFVYTGTSEIYGDVEVPFAEDGPVNPVSPYAVSKYAGERYCRMFHSAYRWPIVCLRPFNAYGPWQSADRVIPDIILTALKGEDVLMTEGRQTREFNYVEDLTAGFVAALEAPGVEGEVINLGCGEEISMREVASRVLSLMGDPVKAHFGALPHRPTEIWRMRSDSSKASRLLGWSGTTDLDTGLSRTIDWFRSRLAAGDLLVWRGR
ncbi:MAG TPA: SDR family NAD(P)-dependent oxidoreductase [Acidimicrobiales bacterium]|nr:SDR family NAD(P)-dependent oxidoreductase [Acidimicrobiales bacterium]